MPKDSHAPPKSYQCHRCSRLFSRSEHLQRHERSHTKEKPFRCPQCPKAFTRKDLLSRHDRLSHDSGIAVSQPLSSATIPITYSSQRPLTSINVLLDSSTVPPSAPSNLNQEAALQNTNGILDAASNATEHLPTPTGTSKYSEDNNPEDNYVKSSLNFPIEDDTTDLFAISSMDDFTSFMDSVSVPTHPFSPTYQPVPLFFQIPEPSSATGSYGDNHTNTVWRNDAPIHTALKSTTLPSVAKDVNPPFSQIGFQLLSLQPEDRTADLALQDHKDPHLHVSAECRERIINDLEGFSTYIDKDFNLPSRHVLSRFFGGYFSSFHDHFPFLHTPTLRPENITVELFLAIAAVGARYTREMEISVDLFHTAKTLLLERIRRHKATRPISIQEDPFRTSFASTLVIGQSASQQEFYPPTSKLQNTIQMIETMLLMVAITTWSEPGSASDALSMRSMLDCLIREEHVLRVHEPSSAEWETWVHHENLKRILFVAFCFINMHTIVFDIPPLMWISEISLDLPCCEKEWRARNEEEWKKIRETTRQPCRNFQEAFRSLFSSISETHERLRTNRTSFSSLGGCALIHALIQQIWLMRNAQLPLQSPEDSISADQMGTFESALKTWAIYWEQNHESSMDPLSPHGPIAFTSTALMRLAYIRLNMNLGPIRYLSSWDPDLVAQSLHASPPVQRSERLTRAALHCAHALSIPVKLGLNYIAETQVRFWSNQHALCSLECALLLAKWLESVTVKDVDPPLTQAEERLLEFVVQLVAETEYRVSYEKVLERKIFLNAQTVRLWAKLYQSKSVWEVVALIGASLNIYADLLENEHSA